MKPILLGIAMIAGLSFSAEAGQVSQSSRRVSPRSVVINLYNQHKKRSPFFQTRSRALLDNYFSRELANLLWKNARSSRDEVGALNGDPLFNAQDMEIKNFTVREGPVGTSTAEVSVSFENFGEKHLIRFRLVTAQPGWKIADLAYDDGSTLLEILKRDRNSGDRRPSIKVYLVALNDDGKTGKKIGCGDSLIAVSRFIQPTAAPLTAALQELLSTPPQADGPQELENFWKGRNLRVKSVAIRTGTATIHISGEVFVAGVCDIPRIESQIEETARQFPNVKKVKVFLGGRTLRDGIR